jgi:uncharacterized protein (TIGR02145 family)
MMFNLNIIVKRMNPVRTILFLMLLTATLIVLNRCSTGGKYPAVTIGDQVWMADNLNIEVPGSYCYEDVPAYCDRYGRLYTMEAAEAACPEGWHIPTESEWMTLFDNIGGIENASLNMREGGSSGLNVIMSGSRFENGFYAGDKDFAMYWCAREPGDTSAMSVIVHAEADLATLMEYPIEFGVSLRCIRDRSDQ